MTMEVPPLIYFLFFLISKKNFKVPPLILLSFQHILKERIIDELIILSLSLSLSLSLRIEFSPPFAYLSFCV
jgi:hypothetical protein